MEADYRPKGCGVPFLVDLFKVFNTIKHELLIDELHAYGFTRDSVLLATPLVVGNMLKSILLSAIFWPISKLTQGAPQWTAVGSLLLNKLFFALKYIENFNFIDDTTFLVCDIDVNTTLNKLEENSAIALTWSKTNYMKLNSDKCHLLVSGHHYEEMFINIRSNAISKSKNVELLGIAIDKDLKFDKHVNRKLN